MNPENDGVDAPVEEDTSFAAFEREATKPIGERAPATDTDTTTAGENGTAVEGEEGEGVDGAPPKGKSVQERMNEITAARREAERVAEERAREVEYWKGMAAGKKPEGEAEQAKPEADANGDPEPDPEKYEYGEADARYLADSARWNARAEFRELKRQEDERAEVAKLNTEHAARVSEAVEKYPDYQEKVQASADRGEWPCSQVMALGIKASPVGPDVAYHLATNRDEAARINALSPLEQARELGRLEAGFMNKPKEVAPEVKAPKAPPPPSHQARGAGGQFETSDDTDDFAAFEAKYGNRSK